MSLLYVICVLICQGVWVHTRRMEEPTCLSRFDYDYKMLNKLIDLEKQQTEMMTKLKEHETIIQEQKLERKNHGSSYTLWGKKGCPGNGSSLVYSGYMAGAKHNHEGSGSNYLCLTSEPIWDVYDDGTASSGTIYGVEYQFATHRSTGSRKFFGQSVYNHNAPCAVCHITRSTSIMIPGRNQCFSGWTKEYSGYLVSGSHGHKQASEYVCLASRLDFVDSNQNDDDEALLYFVEGVCGKSLPCPPYVNRRELTCVVCSL